MVSDVDIRLSIVLKEQEKSVHTVSRKPGDVLDGRIELSGASVVEIKKVTVYFEGVSRNWIMYDSTSDGVTTARAERRFLSQAQDILPQNIIQATSTVEQPDYYAPFHFNISRQLAGSGSNAPEHCLQLPPSLELGEVFVEQTTRERYAQPSITYQLRATVELIDEGGVPSLLRTSMPVVLRANTTEYPPTESEDFPSEFKEFESKVIRKTLTGRPLGTLTISIQEPPALKYGSLSSQSSTKGQLRMDFEAADSSNACSTLNGMNFTLYSLIRVKTFYSVTPFPRLPSQSLLVSEDQFKLRDAVIKLDAGRNYAVSWRYIYNMDAYSTSDSIGSTVEPPKLFAHNAPAKQQPSPHPPIPDGKWTAIIEVPIHLHARVIPTFCNSLVARVYSLIVRLRISGVKCDPFDFEVPLQVVHSLGEAIMEPMRDDFTLLEARRGSENSWFSDQSLESDGEVEQPPQYYI